MRDTRLDPDAIEDAFCKVGELTRLLHDSQARNNSPRVREYGRSLLKRIYNNQLI